ncbi:MAG: hypothetical protein AAFY17_07740, partial [Cyanobacteria bacterium J06642_11]
TLHRNFSGMVKQLKTVSKIGVMFHASESQVEQLNRPQSLSSTPAQMAQVWAKKYLGKLAEQDNPTGKVPRIFNRERLLDQLMSDLRSVSVKAWNLTESLLSHEVKRHGIPAKLIDPWQVSQDAHDVYKKALGAYVERVSPSKLSVQIAADLGKIRQRYTSADPRLIGFVSMQFHYSGQMLLKSVPQSECGVLAAYFKVIDDHLYMPLQRAYEAAANYTYGDERLGIIHVLLPHITTIANNVVNRVNQLYPNYRCYTDRLSHESVRISSVRDVEMFQVYLWTCVLEQNFNAIQAELFPLCVMLYPTLKVNWELVRQMLHLLSREFSTYVTPLQRRHYLPYQDALWAMFSPEIFPDVIELD